MTGGFLSYTGLTDLLERLKALFAKKEDVARCVTVEHYTADATAATRKE